MAIRPELREELMRLPEDERLKLAEELYESVPEPADSERQEAWASEIRRRIEDLRDGRVVGVPAEEAFATVRERLATRER